MQLRGVSFEWKNTNEPGQRIGFVAQEFEKVLPQLVFTNPADGYKGINYAETSAVLVEAMKEQQQAIEELKSENSRLKVQNAQIIQRLEKLENDLNTTAVK